MFDTAACLGAELDDRKLTRDAPEPERLATYASRCKSGFGAPGRRGMSSQVEILQELAGWPEWANNAAGWIAQFARQMVPCADLVDTIPDSWLSPERRKFAVTLLGDFSALMTAWGVEDFTDVMEILGRSGGVQMTDRIELAAYRDETDDLIDPLVFRVAGMKHQDGQASERLKLGDEVELRRESSNPHDKFATLVVVHREHKLGHVPRQYSAIFARLLDSGRRIHATAERQLTLPTESGRWVIRAERAK